MWVVKAGLTLLHTLASSLTGPAGDFRSWKGIADRESMTRPDRFSCSLVCALLILILGVPQCHALWPEPGSDQTAAKPVVTPDLDADPRTDVYAMDKYEAGVRGLLNGNKFEVLDRMASSLRSEKTRFAGGPWKLYVFYRGLMQPAGGRQADDLEWTAHLARLEAWAGHNADSVTARIALAEALFEYAEKGWSDAEAARVSGSKQPEGDSWERIGDRMHAAKVAL
jgi:hypothetical protein